MGPGDRPDSLTPSEQERYPKYVEDKVKAGGIPRTPLGWRQASTAWRTRYVQGKTFEKGLDVVFGLSDAGWQREVPRVVDPASGKEIRVDFHKDQSTSATLARENTEAKSGALNRDRDVDQLEGYQELLRQGEIVRLFTRGERDKEMSKEARALLAAMQAEFPQTFMHRPMKERVYQRVMEAGARALERERRQSVEANLERLPERDQALTVAEIAREYLQEAPAAGIEQLRFMDRELREMARTQAVVERDLAVEDRKGLRLRFHAAQDLEKAHDAQLRQRDDERQSAVDRITFVLTGRERDLIDRGTEQAARELQAQLDSSRINLEQAREQFLGLAYAMGKNQELERRTERDAAARSPEVTEKVVEQLRQKETSRLEKDRPVSRQLGAIGAVVEHETARKQRAELADLAIEVNRERLIARGMDPEKAKWEAIVRPKPVLRDSDRGKDPRTLVHEIAQRDRDHAQAREQTMNAHIAALVEKGVPADTARGIVTARQGSPNKDHRSAQQKEVERAEAQLKAQGITPEIARIAADGRWHEPPAVERATKAEKALAREKEHDRRYGRKR